MGRSEQRGIVFQTRADLGVVGPEPLLPDGQGPAEERFGLGIAPLLIMERRQVVEAGGDVRMVGPEPLLRDGQGALGARLGTTIIPCSPRGPCSLVEISGQDGFGAFGNGLDQLSGLAVVRRGLGIP
jgi:hypothetical protein